MNKILSNPVHPSKVYPTGLILVPTRELVAQTASVVLSLHEHMEGKEDRFNIVKSATGAWKPSFEEKCSVIVATPSVINRTIAHNDFWRYLTYIVVDEADMLLDGNYAPDVHSIIESLRRRTAIKQEPPRQFVFAGATLPHSALLSPGRWLESNFRKALRIKMSGFHQVNPDVKIVWTAVADEEEKQAKVVSALNKSKGKNTIIFTNTVESNIKLSAYLTEALPNVTILPLHKEIKADLRLATVKQFCEDGSSVLVATDMASRGIDNVNVDHVIQADFAHDVIKYLHRVGRTGRAGRGGLVTNITTSEDSKLVKLIKSNPVDMTMDTLFSRKRGLRRQQKKLERQVLENSSGVTESEGQETDSEVEEGHQVKTVESM
jgi:superfamily II DNA/RNA helicase